MEDIVRVNGRGVGRRNGVAPDHGAGALAAENLPGIEIGGLKRIKFVSKASLPFFSPMCPIDTFNLNVHNKDKGDSYVYSNGTIGYGHAGAA